MTLAKEDIKFIEDYLKKNEVKFWDVRVELLDHIVSAVENDMNENGVSFNEALLDAHRSFGNQVLSQRLSKTQLFNKGLYQDNSGFKKFIKQKQKDIGLKNRKRYWIIVKELLTSFKFLFEYALFLTIIYVCYLNSPKSALIITLIALVIPEIYKFRYVFRRGMRYSLNANMVGVLYTSFLCMQGLVLQLYKDYFGDLETTPYYYIIIAYCIIYPLARANMNLYIETIKKYQERYKLLLT